MLTLSQLQQGFAKSMFDETLETLNPFINQDGLSVQERLQIYRNNIYTSLSDALKSIYPTIQKLVGEAFFLNIARDYITRYPSVSGDLHDFGKAFPHYLSQLLNSQHLPYLPEMAQLEWAYHEVFHESDCDPFNFIALQQVPKECYETIRFILNPACRLCCFQFPILQIWSFCQEETPSETLHLENTSAEKILVIRQQNDIRYEKLTNGEFIFLSSLQKVYTLQEAYRLSDKVEHGFAVNEALLKFLHNQTIIDFAV